MRDSEGEAFIRFGPLRVSMESPAARLERVLIGIAIPAAFLSALALSEGRIEVLGCTGTSCASINDAALVLPIVVIICLAGLLILRISRGREHGEAPLDRWFSREPESMMRERLEEERFDADDEGMSSRWAELEKKKLEERYGEEE